MSLIESCHLRFAIEVSRQRSNLQNAGLRSPEPLTDAVTCSFGVAELMTMENDKSLLHRVGKALYQAKALGRNNVGQPTPSGD